MNDIAATPSRYTNRVIYGRSGPGFEQVDRTPPLAGFFEVVCHGGDGQVWPFVERCEQAPRSAADLAAFIRGLPQYQGEPIRLLICEAGAGHNSVAQQVADLLGRAVAAPCEAIWAEDLRTVSGSPFIIVIPRRAEQA